MCFQNSKAKMTSVLDVSVLAKSIMYEGSTQQNLNVDIIVDANNLVRSVPFFENL